ncbi:MAG: MauE/DoxX family redox-associated membrane protein, partial [Acidimicrobiales bacterium]
MELTGLYLVACFLLIVAGAGKAARPDDTARALVALPRTRLPLNWVRSLVRMGSVAELSLGLAGLLVPGPTVVWLVAASYALFATVVAYTRWRGGALASCGCFGTPDTPATALHVVVDLV